MRIGVICLMIFLLGQNLLSAQTGWTDKTRILPDTLRNVPVGITLYHSPNPNYPVPNKTVGDGNAKYLWKHSTSVRSEVGDLEVVAAGSFIWYSENGWFTNLQLDPAEFAERFECKDALLKAGKTYTYKKNYRYGYQLYGGDALWFVLAIDRQGKLYKGIGLIETESELQEE